MLPILKKIWACIFYAQSEKAALRHLETMFVVGQRVCLLATGEIFVVRKVINGFAVVQDAERRLRTIDWATAESHIKAKLASCWAPI